MTKPSRKRKKITDKMRLDWLQKSNWDKVRLTLMSLKHYTDIRQAIDSAMKEKP